MDRRKALTRGGRNFLPDFHGCDRLPALGAPDLGDLELVVNSGDQKLDVRLDGGEALSLFLKSLGEFSVVGGVGDGGELRLEEIVDELLGEEVADLQSPGDPLQREENGSEGVDAAYDGGGCSYSPPSSR